MTDTAMFEKRSQDLQTYYHDAAHFVWGRREAWLEGKNVFSSRSVPVYIPRHTVHDLDDEQDLKCLRGLAIAARL